MGTQVLKGSKGTYTPLSPRLTVEEFEVTEDTCLEAKYIPIVLLTSEIKTTVQMCYVNFSPTAKYKDY